MIPEWLKDAKLIVAIISFLLTAFGLIFFQWWKNRKALGYTIESNDPLFTVKSDIKDRVEILFDGKPVKDVYLIKIKVWNKGYVPIERNDFDTHLKILLTNGEIISSDVMELHPKDLLVETEQFTDSILIKPLLLNRKDSFTVKVLISYSDNIDIAISGRIKGIQKIENFKPEYRNAVLVQINNILFGAVTSLMGIIAFGSSLYTFLTKQLLIITGLTLFVVIIAAIFVYFLWKNKD